MRLFNWKRKDKDGYSVRASRLDGLQMGEYDKEAEKIVQEYGGVIAKVMAEVRTKYPAMVFPSSLLPASKADIKESFDMFLDPGSFDLPEEQRTAMYSTYTMLDRFIDDEDAKAKNDEYHEHKKN